MRNAAILCAVLVSFTGCAQPVAPQAGYAYPYLTRTRILTRIHTIHGSHLEIASAVGFITSTIAASAVASPIDPMRSSIIMAAPVRITGTITGTTERITKL